MCRKTINRWLRNRDRARQLQEESGITQEQIKLLFYNLKYRNSKPWLEKRKENE